MITNTNTLPRLLPGDRSGRPSAREVEGVDEMWEMAATLASEGDNDIMLHDNRNDSCKYSKEGSLFVRRSPHQVRPPVDADIRYRLNEADKVFKVSFERSASDT